MLIEKTDRRIQRTHQLLWDALTALILEKGYEHITIKDITDRANVAYATFFRHFANKEALLMHHLERVKDDINTLMIAPETNTEKGIILFQHVAAQRVLYRVLLNTPATLPVLKQLKHSIAQIFIKECELQGLTQQSQIPAELVGVHIAAGLLNLIEWWLDNELPCSAEAMAAIYSEFVINASMNAVAHTKI
jgi:AcrR family transcriptional regulator